MKKYLVVLGLFLVPMVAMADGNYTPALVTSTVTGQGYLYPATGANNPPLPGSTLVGNGTLFNWSNAPVLSTNQATANQFLGLTNVTAAQIAALQSSTTGQMVYCSNCATSYGSAVCVSTGGFAGTTLVGQFILSTGTVCK